MKLLTLVATAISLSAHLAPTYAVCDGYEFGFFNPTSADIKRTFKVAKDGVSGLGYRARGYCPENADEAFCVDDRLFIWVEYATVNCGDSSTPFRICFESTTHTCAPNPTPNEQGVIRPDVHGWNNVVGTCCGHPKTERVNSIPTERHSIYWVDPKFDQADL